MNVWGDECLRWWISGWWMSVNPFPHCVWKRILQKPIPDVVMFWNNTDVKLPFIPWQMFDYIKGRFVLGDICAQCFSAKTSDYFIDMLCSLKNGALKKGDLLMESSWTHYLLLMLRHGRKTACKEIEIEAWSELRPRSVPGKEILAVHQVPLLDGTLSRKEVDHNRNN